MSLVADSDVVEASRLMLSFADRTGLTSASSERRYLWTDSFAVCNFLGLARQTGDAHYLELALRLVERVHQVLGRYRHDDARRSGWISGLSELQGALHPTRGGLRIGKALPERELGEAFDPDLEWERDGQYFHYLTQWMHALDQTARHTRDARFNVWARELAARAYNAFTHLTLTDERRMSWKMSIDLTRPLVSTMGQHDPLDGLVSCLELSSTATQLRASALGPNLEGERSTFAAMAHNLDFMTTDPLGIGGLLVDAHRLAQLGAASTPEISALQGRLLSAAARGLTSYLASGALDRPAPERLAFRELGLAIGLRAVASMPKGSVASGEPLRTHRQLATELQTFWLADERSARRTWAQHQDIDDVMLATCLAPVGFLGIVPNAERA